MTRGRFSVVRRAVAVALAVALALPGAARADSVETELKAAYLYNFIRFVEWPGSDRTDAISVCVAGPAATRKGIAAELAGRKVGNRPVVVRAAERPADTAGCDVLYVASADADVARRFVAAVPRDRVVTVTDADGFPATGALINFYLEDQTLHFAVNADLLGASQFKLSSQMLQFGTMVSAKGTGK